MSDIFAPVDGLGEKFSDLGCLIVLLFGDKELNRRIVAASASILGSVRVIGWYTIILIYYIYLGVNVHAKRWLYSGRLAIYYIGRLVRGALMPLYPEPVLRIPWLKGLISGRATYRASDIRISMVLRGSGSGGFGVMG